MRTTPVAAEKHSAFTVARRNGEDMSIGDKKEGILRQQKGDLAILGDSRWQGL